MKLLFGCIFGFFCSVITVFASDTLELSVNPQNAVVGEVINFQLRAQVEDFPPQGQFDFQYEGAESLLLFSQGPFVKQEFVGGKIFTKLVYQMQFIAREETQDSIKNVILKYINTQGDEIILKNEEEILITVSHSHTAKTSEDSEVKQSKISTEKQNEDNSLLSQIILLRYPSFIFVKLFITLGVLISIFFFLLSKLSKKSVASIPVVEDSMDYVLAAKNLADQIEHMAQRAWYHEFHALIRGKLSEIIKKEMQHLTLKEFEFFSELQGNPFLDLLRESYYCAYSQDDSSRQQQKKHIKKFISLL